MYCKICGTIYNSSKCPRCYLQPNQSPSGSSIITTEVKQGWWESFTSSTGGKIVIGFVVFLAVLKVIALIQDANRSDRPVTNNTSAGAVSVAIPTATSIPQPTATPGLTTRPDNGWAVVEEHVRIWDFPGQNVIDTTSKPVVVQWQRQTLDLRWFERLGGGWVEYKDAIQKPSKDSAYEAVGISLAIPPTAVPNPIVPSTPDDPEILSILGELTYSTSGCVIKGNVSVRDGEKIYHVPGQYYYDSATIDPLRGERWFCEEEDAIMNGWRKSLR